MHRRLISSSSRTSEGPNHRDGALWRCDVLFRVRKSAIFVQFRSGPSSFQRLAFLRFPLLRALPCNSSAQYQLPPLKAFPDQFKPFFMSAHLGVHRGQVVVAGELRNRLDGGANARDFAQRFAGRRRRPRPPGRRLRPPDRRLRPPDPERASRSRRTLPYQRKDPKSSRLAPACH